MAQDSPPDPAWLARIDAALPQTQCTRCGEPDCAAYALAIGHGAAINRCPPGGEAGIHRLAELTGRPFEPLDPAHGSEGPRRVAWIDEAACIGCTLCIEACPVDCIVGAPKHMHSIVEPLCTGCELCLPACPVDCIHLDLATPGASGWAAWSQALADTARSRYRHHLARLQRVQQEQAARLTAAAQAADTAAATAAPSGPAADGSEAKRAAIAAALARARARRGGGG